MNALIIAANVMIALLIVPMGIYVFSRIANDIIDKREMWEAEAKMAARARGRIIIIGDIEEIGNGQIMLEGWVIELNGAPAAGWLLDGRGAIAGYTADEFREIHSRKSEWVS